MVRAHRQEPLAETCTMMRAQWFIVYFLSILVPLLTLNHARSFELKYFRNIVFRSLGLLTFQRGTIL